MAAVVSLKPGSKSRCRRSSWEIISYSGVWLGRLRVRGCAEKLCPSHVDTFLPAAWCRSHFDKLFPTCLSPVHPHRSFKVLRYAALIPLLNILCSSVAFCSKWTCAPVSTVSRTSLVAAKRSRRWSSAVLYHTIRGCGVSLAPGTSASAAARTASVKDSSTISLMSLLCSGGGASEMLEMTPSITRL